MSNKWRFPLVTIDSIAFDARGVPIQPALKFSRWNGAGGKLRRSEDKDGVVTRRNSKFEWKHKGAKLISFRRFGVLYVEPDWESRVILELTGMRDCCVQMAWDTKSGATVWMGRLLSPEAKHGITAFVRSGSEAPRRTSYFKGKLHGLLYAHDEKAVHWLDDAISLDEYNARLPEPANLSRLGASPAVARHICKFV